MLLEACAGAVSAWQLEKTVLVGVSAQNVTHTQLEKTVLIDVRAHNTAHTRQAMRR